MSGWACTDACGECLDVPDREDCACRRKPTLASIHDVLTARWAYAHPGEKVPRKVNAALETVARALFLDVYKDMTQSHVLALWKDVFTENIL